MPNSEREKINCRKEYFAYQLMVGINSGNINNLDKIYITTLDSEKLVELTFTKFNFENEVASFELKFNNTVLSLYSNLRDLTNFVTVLQHNLDKLLEMQGTVFIDEDEYKIHYIRDNNEINYLTKGSPIEAVFGPSFSQLDSSIIDDYRDYRGDGTLKSPLTHYIDKWKNPLLNWHNSNQELEEYLIPMRQSGYEHHVIIQVGGDNVISGITASLLNKHPENTSVIQFDVHSQQWRVLKGDLNAVPVGKIRWIFTGHGNFSNTRAETLYEGSTADAFVSGFMYLKNNVLTHYPPDKIVLFGCSLARGGVNQNFALKAHLGLAQQGINIPMVGYNRRVAVNRYGAKVLFPRDDNSPIRTYSKEHRVEFITDPITKRTYINQQTAVLYFINQVRNGELMIWHLQKENNSNIMDIFKNPDNENKIDLNLIKKVAFNPHAYNTLEREMDNYDYIIDDGFHKYLSSLLVDKGIMENPLWLMVDKNEIKNKQSNIAFNDASITVVFRANSSQSGKKKAEKIASLNPDNTIILQADISQFNTVVEYGDVSRLSDNKNINWVLIDNENNIRNFSSNIISTMLSFQLNHGLHDIDHISVLMTNNKVELSIDSFSNIPDALKQSIIEQGIVLKSPLEVSVVNLLDEDIRRNERKIQLILNKLAREEMFISRIDMQSEECLKKYFIKINGALDYKKLNIALYDPIASTKVNEFFNKKSIFRDYNSWDSIFDNEQAATLEQQANDVKKLLNTLSLKSETIAHLGKTSTERLRMLFPTDYGFDHHAILNLVKQPELLSIYNERLDNLIDACQKDGENLKIYPLTDAMEYIRTKEYRQYREEKDKIQLLPTASSNASTEPNSDKIVEIGGVKTTLGKLKGLGVIVNNEPINKQNTQGSDWLGKVTFNGTVLAEDLTFLDESKKNINKLKIIKSLIGDTDIRAKLEPDITLQEYAIAHKQLEIVKSIDIENKASVSKKIKELHNIGIKLPIYSRIANKAGQVSGGVGVFMTINGIYQLIDELDDPNLSEEEREVITKNLSVMCASAFFNYGDMVVQPILLKMAYKQAGAFNASGKLTARITIIFNLIGMGLDIYQACEAFEQFKKITDQKERQDLIVNGSLSLANIVVGGVTIVGILIGSATVPVIGLIIGGALLIGGMVYNGIRAVEKIEEELGESLGWDEQAKEGIRAALGFKPSDDILNRFSQKQHIAYFKNKNWQQDLDNYKSSFLYQGFDEHLQFVEKPILGIEDKYYIKRWESEELIDCTLFDNLDMSSPLNSIDKDDVGPCYTIEQIDYIRTYYDYDAQTQKWVKTGFAQNINEINFDRTFRLSDKVAPLSYKEIGKKSSNDIFVLNSDYDSDLLSVFLNDFDLQHQYTDKKNQELISQLAGVSSAEIRLFRSRNNYTHSYHPDINSDIEVKRLGNEYINQLTEINEKLLSKQPEMIYKGMHNISYTYEEEARQKSISINSGGGTDIVIGKKMAKNVFNTESGSKFFAGGKFNDIVNMSLKNNNSEISTAKLFFDGNGGDNTLIIRDIPKGSQLDVDLNQQIVTIELDNTNIQDVYLHNVNNIMLSGSHDSGIRMIGNRDNNLLDSGTGHAFINGDDGDDRIIFESGMINGGNGNDSYHMRRFDWNRYLNRSSDSQEKINLNTTIIETKNSLSTVNLGYSLSEITGISVSSNDVIVAIKMATPEDMHEVVEFNITLKNCYIEKQSSRELNHQYKLITRDGFELNPQLNELNSRQSQAIKEKLYAIVYQQNTDSLNGGVNEQISINEEKNTMTIGNRIYQSPSWGEFKFNGLVNNLMYTGSNGNNQLVMVNRNSKIIVTKGVDVYQVNPEQYLQGKLVFDFSSFQGQLTEEDKIIISLPEENGYTLQVDNHSIYLENIFNDKKLEIKFVNYNALMECDISLQDGNKNTFQIKLKEEGCEIINNNIVKVTTNKNDIINLYAGYECSSPIIDGQAGNDIIKNNTGKGLLINGGVGDDIITANMGVNILYGNDGDDFIYGGRQGDLLLSDLGNDVLSGRKGNDDYIIDGSKGDGTTEIYDIEGINNIHLLHFNRNYLTENENGITYYIYHSSSNLRKVKIKMILETEANKNIVYHHEQFPAHFPNYTRESMSDLVRYLAEQKQYSKHMEPLLLWQPMDEFKTAFRDDYFLPINLSTPEIKISEGSHFRQLVIHTQGKEQRVWDSSGHGRVIKAEAQKGTVSIAKGNISHNVLYAGLGENNLSGGDGNDVFISNGSNGLLSDAAGKNTFIINGDLEGWNSVFNYGGENTIHLINFKKTPIREEPDHLSNATRYIYESEKGRSVKIYQYPNTQAPVIMHHKVLPGAEAYSTEQKLEYLVNTLASIRLQDEHNSLGTHEKDSINKGWKPVSYVESLMAKAS